MADKDLKSKLSYRDKEMLIYFWKYKEDLDRWCDFETLKPLVKKEFPAIYKNWHDMKICAENLDNAIDKLEEEL